MRKSLVDRQQQDKNGQPTINSGNRRRTKTIICGYIRGRAKSSPKGGLGLKKTSQITSCFHTNNFGSSLDSIPLS
jgi:hypothetical protein